MLVTLDTNSVYQALMSTSGASHFILQQVRERHIQIALSVPVFYEYQDVLTRESSLRDFQLDKKDIETFLRFIAYIARVFRIYYLFRPNLQDEKDNMILELAIASRSDVLITSNIRDFQQAELRFDQLHIMTPSDFVKMWREQHASRKHANHQDAD